MKVLPRFQNAIGQYPKTPLSYCEENGRATEEKDPTPFFNTRLFYNLLEKRTDC